MRWLILTLLVGLPIVAQVSLPARRISTPTPAATGSSLTGDLVAYWRLDETSGNRADAEPSGTPQTLTVFNSVTAVVGVITNAAFWNGTEYLTRAGADTALQGGDRDFTWVTWVKTTTAADQMGVLSRGGAAAYEYMIAITNVSGLKFHFLMNSQADGANASAQWSSTITDGVWYCIIAWFDSTNNLIYISVNDGTPVSASMTLTPIAATTAFFMGANASGNYMSGAIDETGYWTRLLTAGERTTLYNGGVGKTYPFSP